jgi:epoxyqueuosine reductase
MTGSAGNLQGFLDGLGWRARVVPIEHLDDLRADIEGRRRQGLFDETFYQERLTFFSFELPEDLPAARSLIIVAVPVPACRAHVAWLDGKVPLVLPPTYVGYSRTTRTAVDRIAGLLQPDGYRVAGTRLPLKTLAVRSGLGAYGRNNIVYVPGMGSYLQLGACFSDLPPEDDPWREPAMLERCEDCIACLRRCPTGAIAPDRFLLHAERCLVFHNERNEAFPGWIDPAWHNSLIGCMLCQFVCPEDKPYWDRFENLVDLTEAEAHEILDGLAIDQMSLDLVEKLRALDLSEDLPILPRNLAALLSREPNGAASLS